ncbi:MAG TPA: caspase family protein [Pyrinomonadaceae bacterium]
MKVRRKSCAGFVASLLAALAVAVSLTGSGAPHPAQAASFVAVAEPRRLALLVGISNYQRRGAPDEWGHLNTELDLELLQQVLVDKFKFAAADITVLRDKKATRDAILSEMRNLVARAGRGDVVFLHYSGHGDTIPDDNGDEVDGRDESLVPFDYVSKKDHSKNIRDDEVGKILDELKKKGPASVTVSLDSCYSGTATRGDYAGRGGSGDFAKPDDESPSGLMDKNASFPSSYVFLAASSPRQTAKETDYDGKQRIGVYTLALVKALNEATPRTTYRDLFERINDIVTSKRGDQNPQLEGQPDGLVFDGTAVRQERYAQVKPAAAGKKNDKAILRTGRLLGATAKSRYALYGPGTKSPDDKEAVKLTEGEIVEVGATSSVIRLDRPIEAETLKTARAFETQHYYEETALKVYLQDLRRVKGGEAALTEFVGDGARGGPSSGGQSFNLAVFKESKADESLRGEPYDVRVYPAGEREVKDGIVPAGFAGVVLERKDGSTLAAVAEGENLSRQVKEALERENRFRVIKGLGESEDPRLKVGLRLVPADVEFNAARQVVKVTSRGEAAREAGGRPEFKVGDYFMLEVENRGDLDVYVTILDLRPDGKIGPGFPQDVSGTPDNLIRRGSKVLIPLPYVFRVTEPLGEESFRLIATLEPTDFTPLIDEELISRARAGSRGDGVVARLLDELGRGRTARGGPVNNAAQSPLGRILLASAVGTRSNLAASAPPSWATSSFTFVVKEK